MKYGFCHPMLVEDDPAFAELMSKALASAGVPRGQVRTLIDGDQAVAELGAKDKSLPSFVLLDQTLPGKSGLEVLAWLRSVPRLRHLAVFMLSGSGQLEHGVRAFEIGVQSYFIKPSDYYELEAVVEGILAYWYRRRWVSDVQSSSS